MRRSFFILALLIMALGTKAQRFNNTYDLGGSDIGMAVLSDSTGYYVTGDVLSDNVRKITFTKLGLNGELLWTRKYKIFNGSGAGKPGSLVRDIAGNFYLASWVNIITDTLYPLVLKLSPTGDSLDLFQFPTIGTFQNLCLTSDSAIVAVGAQWNGVKNSFLAIKMDLQGNQIWERTISFAGRGSWAWNVSETSDGEYIIGGSTWANDDADPLVVRLDVDGNELWRRSLNPSDLGDGNASIHVDDAGNIFVGASAGKIKFSYTEGVGYVAKLNPSGDVLWEKEYGDSASLGSDFTQIVGTRNGNLLMVATTSRQTAINPLENLVGWVIEIDTSGALIHEKYFEYDSNPATDSTNGYRQYARSIDTTADGGFVTAGWIGGTPTQDLWVVKFDSNGCYDLEFDCVVGLAETPADAQSLRMWPNPAADRVMVEVPFPARQSTIELYSVHGQLQRAQSFRASPVALDLTGLPAGAYFCVWKEMGEVRGGQTLIVR